jgi:hypothetical protein
MSDAAAAAAIVAAESPAKRQSRAGMACTCCLRAIEVDANERYVTFKDASVDGVTVYLCHRCIERQPANLTLRCDECNQPIEADSPVLYRRYDCKGVAKAQDDEDSDDGRYIDGEYLQLSHAECKWQCSSCKFTFCSTGSARAKRHVDPANANKYWCENCTVQCLICHQWALFNDKANVIAADDHDGVCVHESCARIAGVLYTAMFKQCAESVMSLTTTAFAAAIESTKRGVATAAAAAVVGEKRNHNGEPAAAATVSDTERATDSSTNGALRGRRRGR